MTSTDFCFYFKLTNNREFTDKLKPCPFCGNKIMLSKIGNGVSKKKSVEIYCEKCKYEIVKSSLRTHEDALRFVVDMWENRFEEKKGVE